jgi:predicted RNase H-like nuclease (RuvC/YqgF family)
VILLNQAGKTSDRAIRDSLDLFAREVMPEFHAQQPAQDAWKEQVLSGRIVLEELDTSPYDLYAHQNEDIVRLTPEQLKQRMEEKERIGGAGRD